MASDGNIKDNSNTHPRGSPEFKKKAWEHTHNEWISFGIAEVVGGLTTVGAMYTMQMVPKSLMDAASTGLGEMLEPFQKDYIEKTIGAVCKLDECKPDETKSVKQRAKEFARIVLISAPAITASWGVKWWVRRIFNRKLHVAEDKRADGAKWYHISPEEVMLGFADEGTHIAAMGVVQSKSVAPTTDKLIVDMTSVFQTWFGMSHKSGHELATMIAIHEIPNAIAAVTSGAVIAGRHHYGWPGQWVKKLFSGGKPAASHVEELYHTNALGDTLHQIA